MNKKIINEFMDFAEGRMNAEIFYYNLCNKKEYETTLKSDSAPFPFLKDYNNNLFDYFKTEVGFNKKNLFIKDKYALHGEIVRFLEKNNCKVSPIKDYDDIFSLLMDIQPDWLDISDEDFLMGIINQAPLELSDSKKKSWCKKKLIELFQYEEKKPRWIQDPEWPIKNGKPLIFKCQTEEKQDDERVNYYFYDSDTGEEKVITQVY